MKNAKSVVVLGMAACLWFVPGACGSTLSSITLVIGPPGTISGTATTVSPNSNPGPGTPGYTGPNTLAITEDVTSPTSSWQATGSLILGTGWTEYYVTKTITNGTGLTWDDLEILMGNSDTQIECPTVGGPTITGPGTASATLGCSLLQTLPSDYAELTFTNLNVGPSQKIVIGFDLDVESNVGGGYRFIEQYSATPEPAVVFPTGSALVLLGIFRRKRARVCA